MVSTRDAEIYLAQPGLGSVLGARVLAEFGDDPTRYACARKNYAGTSPITPTSARIGSSRARYVRNNRLTNAPHLQAFSALSGSPGARASYQALRDRDINDNAAFRQLGKRLVEPAHPTSGRFTSKPCDSGHAGVGDDETISALGVSHDSHPGRACHGDD